MDRDRSPPRGYGRYNNNSLTGIGMKMYIKTTSKQKGIENENKTYAVVVVVVVIMVVVVVVGR